MCHLFYEHIMLSSSNARQQHLISILQSWKSLLCPFPTGIFFSWFEGPSCFVKMAAITSLFISFVFLLEIQSREFKILPPWPSSWKYYFCLNCALAQDPKHTFTNSFSPVPQNIFLLTCSMSTCIGSACFCLATHETQHTPPTNFKDKTSKKKKLSSTTDSFSHIPGFGSLRILSSFNEMLLDDLNWILLVPKWPALSTVARQTHPLVLVRVNMRVWAAKRKRWLKQSRTVLYPQTQIWHLAVTSLSVIPLMPSFPKPKYACGRLLKILPRAT